MAQGEEKTIEIWAEEADVEDREGELEDGEFSEELLERKMMEWEEMRQDRDRMIYNMTLKKNAIDRLLRAGGMSTHEMSYDKDHLIQARRSVVRQSIFDKEQMAEDLDAASPSETTKKDFLINKAQKGELTLEKYKDYISYDREEVTKVGRKKKSKKWKKDHGEPVE